MAAESDEASTQCSATASHKNTEDDDLGCGNSPIHEEQDALLEEENEEERMKELLANLAQGGETFGKKTTTRLKQE